MTTSPLTRGRSLTAAAQVLQGPKVDRVGRRRKSSGMPWQQSAWEFYDCVGEYALGVDMLAWGVSQVQLVSAREVPNADEPEIVSADAVEGSDEQPSAADIIAADLVADFAGGATGQQQLLNRIATQLVVSAEAFIVGREADNGDDVWESYSRDEIKIRGNGDNVVYAVDDGVDKFVLRDQTDVLIRVWMPHPRRRQEPRSSSKSLLPILAEIDSLTKSIQARNDSHVAGAGIMIWPDSVELIGGTKPGDDEDEGDSFVAEVMDMMLTPMHDRSSAATVVPIMVKVPLEAVGKVQWLMRPTPATATDAEDRETAIKRMARAMDLPPEQILGTGDANHWGAWMIAEDTIKGPITNFASIIVHAITQAWYRAALEAAYEAANIPVAEADGRMIWFDTTALEQRPDRSEQVVAAFDRGGQNIEGLVRELGLNVEDIPDETEMLRILLFLLAKTDPAAAVQLLADPQLFERIVSTAKPVDQIQAPDDGAADIAAEQPADVRALPEQPTQNETPGAAA